MRRTEGAAGVCAMREASTAPDAPAGRRQCWSPHNRRYIPPTTTKSYISSIAFLHHPNTVAQNARYRPPYPSLCACPDSRVITSHPTLQHPVTIYTPNLTPCQLTAVVVAPTDPCPAHSSEAFFQANTHLITLPPRCNRRAEVRKASSKPRKCMHPSGGNMCGKARRIGDPIFVCNVLFARSRAWDRRAYRFQEMMNAFA
jgi:hypothetical protein